MVFCSHTIVGLLGALLFVGLAAGLRSTMGSRSRRRGLTNWELDANPVSMDGSNYRSDITEAEAFQWFDEAYVHVRAGSGGSGSNAMKFGKHRQHVAPQGGSGGTGGSVIFTVDSSSNTLLGFRKCIVFRDLSLYNIAISVHIEWYIRQL